MLQRSILQISKIEGSIWFHLQVERMCKLPFPHLPHHFPWVYVGETCCYEIVHTATSGGRRRSWEQLGLKGWKSLKMNRACFHIMFLHQLLTPSNIYEMMIHVLVKQVCGCVSDMRAIQRRATLCLSWYLKKHLQIKILWRPLSESNDWWCICIQDIIRSNMYDRYIT